MTILFLGLAGALGGAAERYLLWLFRGWPGPPLDLYYPVMDGALGLAIGTSLAVSHRIWIRFLASLVLGALAFLVANSIDSVIGERGPTVKISWRAVEMILLFGAIPVLLVTVAHHLYLRWRSKQGVILIADAFYLMLGGMSKVFGVFTVIRNDPTGTSSLGTYVSEVVLRLYPAGFLAGAVFGLVQFLAILATTALDRKIGSRPGPPHPHEG